MVYSMPRRPKQLFVERREQPRPLIDGICVSSCKVVTSALSEGIEVGSTEFQRFAGCKARALSRAATALTGSPAMAKE